MLTNCIVVLSWVLVTNSVTLRQREIRDIGSGFVHGPVLIETTKAHAVTSNLVGRVQWAGKSYEIGPLEKLFVTNWTTRIEEPQVTTIPVKCQ